MKRNVNLNVDRAFVVCTRVFFYGSRFFMAKIRFKLKSVKLKTVNLGTKMSEFGGTHLVLK